MRLPSKYSSKLSSIYQNISALSLIVSLSLVIFSACDELEELGDELLDDLTGDYKTGPRKLSGDDAFKHLSPDRSSAPETNVASIQRVIDQEIHLENTGSMMMESDEADEFLRGVVYERQRFDLNNYQLIDIEDRVDSEMGTQQKSNCSFELPEPLLMYEDYLIPGLEKIPVRDQMRRGTCAAFAGIGSIEYAALNSVDPEDPDGGPSANLSTLDLSEQRFYWMSKPDCQGPNGCECPGCAEGSWYGKGMESSANDASGSYNIPLETDCPYNGEKGANDTQYPQANSCTEGAVRVEEVSSWCGTDDLIELLHRGYAVPYGSPLSSNWENNDGLITAKGIYEQGSTVHAGGHAYLIVGYRLLPDMPEEGGMCFYVKNSWGKGWGAGGIACQTLQWMREVTFDGFISLNQPVALKVSIREDLRGAETLPDNDMAETEEAEELPEEEEIVEEEELIPAPQPDLDPEENESDPETEPVDEEMMPSGEFSYAKLYGPNETYYEVEISEEDDELLIRGLLRQRLGETKAMRVKAEGDKLIYKGDVVGRRNGDTLTLCTGKWSSLCSLRYRKSDGLFYLQFRDDDLRKVKPEEVSAARGEWYDLDLGAGSRYGVFLPKDVISLEFLANPKTYVRLGGKNAARVSLRKVEDEVDFDIRLGGQDIGILKLSDPLESALCSGSAYRDRCQLRGVRDTFVLPRNRGKRQRREP